MEASGNNKWTIKTIKEIIETHEFLSLVDYVRKNIEILKILPFRNE